MTKRWQKLITVSPNEQGHVKDVMNPIGMLTQSDYCVFVIGQTKRIGIIRNYPICRWQELNLQPMAYKATALTVELHRHH